MKIPDLIQEINNTEIINYDWFEYQASKGRVRKEFLPSIKSICKITEHIYPGNWDLQADIVLNETVFIIMPQVIIYFDSFDVTNSKNQHITVKDFYVRVTFDDANNMRDLCVSSIMGARTTFTAAEHNSTYSWSHLHRHSINSPISWKGFCLGSDGAMKAAMYNTNEKWDDNLYTLFLLELQTYLSWESIEGGPYKRMETIAIKDFDVITLITDEEFDALMLRIYNEIEIDDFDIEIEDGEYILDKSSIDDFLINKLNIDAKFVFRLDENGKLYRLLDFHNYKPNNTNTDIWYKGINPKLTIIDEDIPQDMSPKVVSEKVKAKIAAEFQKKIKNTLINEYAE